MPTDPTADLRDRIADALKDADYDLPVEQRYDLADAVLAVLPEQTSRAAVLLWAADQIDAETQQAKDHGVLEPWKFRPCRDASEQLRRLAAEDDGTGTQ